MRLLGSVTLLALLAGTAAVAQDGAAGRQPAAEQPGAAAEPATTEPATDDVAQTSPLDELAWMIGQWIDRGEESTITADCKWTKNRKFLARSFRIETDGETSLEGTEVIGWDPIERQVRSWTFDSEGGFGEGRWTRDGSRWLVKTSFVLPSGERASAINVFTYVDPDTFRWQSVDREVGGELQPSIPEVTVVRQKPGDTGSEGQAAEGEAEKQEASQ